MPFFAYTGEGARHINTGDQVVTCRPGDVVELPTDPGSVFLRAVETPAPMVADAPAPAPAPIPVPVQSPVVVAEPVSVHELETPEASGVEDAPEGAEPEELT